MFIPITIHNIITASSICYQKNVLHFFFFRSQSPEFPPDVSISDKLDISVSKLQLDSIKSVGGDAEEEEEDQRNLRRSTRKSIVNEKKTPKIENDK